MTLWLLQLSVALTSATVRPAAVQTLVLSDQAVRLLALDSRSFQTEFLGCMIGEIRNGVVRVDRIAPADVRSEEHTSELQSRPHLVCRLLLEKKKRRSVTPTWTTSTTG